MDKPKKPRSSFLFFSTEMRKSGTISASKLKELWESLKNDPSRKREYDYYVNLAEQQLAKYRQELKLYNENNLEAIEKTKLLKKLDKLNNNLRLKEEQRREARSREIEFQLFKEEEKLYNQIKKIKNKINELEDGEGTSVGVRSSRDRVDDDSNIDYDVRSIRDHVGDDESNIHYDVKSSRDRVDVESIKNRVESSRDRVDVESRSKNKTREPEVRESGFKSRADIDMNLLLQKIKNQQKPVSKQPVKKYYDESSDNSDDDL